MGSRNPEGQGYELFGDRSARRAKYALHERVEGVRQGEASIESLQYIHSEMLSQAQEKARELGVETPGFMARMKNLESMWSELQGLQGKDLKRKINDYINEWAVIDVIFQQLESKQGAAGSSEKVPGIKEIEPHLFLDISSDDANKWGKLFYAINNLSEGGLQGSQKFYSSKELVDIINEVRKDESQLKKVTSAGGLYETVVRFLDADKKKVEKPQVLETREVKEIESSFSLGSVTQASPEHPGYCEDWAATFETKDGGALLMVADGVSGRKGSGRSQEAAQIAQEEIATIAKERKVGPLPTTDEAQALLDAALERASFRIKDVQTRISKENPDLSLEDKYSVDTTICAGMVALSPDSKKMMVNVHVADSRQYKFNPRTGLEQITFDHSTAQLIAETDMIKKKKNNTDQLTRTERQEATARAFYSKTSGEILETLGNWKAGRRENFFTITPIEKGDIFMNCTDGFSDNVPPETQELVFKEAYKKAMEGRAFNPTVFVNHLRQVARQNMEKGDNFVNPKTKDTTYSKQDDIGISVLGMGVGKEAEEKPVQQDGFGERVKKMFAKFFPA